MLEMIRTATLMTSLLFLVSEVMAIWVRRESGRLDRESTFYKLYGPDALRLDTVIVFGIFINAVLILTGELFNLIIAIIVVGLYATDMKIKPKSIELRLIASAIAIVGATPMVKLWQIVPSSFLMWVITLLILWIVGAILKVQKFQWIIPWQVATATLITIFDGATILERLGFLQ